MKINWGTGIAIFLCAYIGWLIFSLFLSRTHKNDLVVEEYYKEDLSYQSHFEKWENSVHSKIQPKVTYNHDHLTTVFPSAYYPVKGELLLYRPSNAAQDQKHTFNLVDTNLFRIYLPEIAHGYWKTKINWRYEENKFYNESEIIIEK